MREHIAENVCSLSPVIGREPSITELLPLVKLFLADEQEGTASIEIRRKVLRSVAPLVETLGADACDQHLMPEVCSIAVRFLYAVSMRGAQSVDRTENHMYDVHVSHSAGSEDG